MQQNTKEAGIQDAAVPTYRPNDSVTALITDSNGNIANPNIVSSAVEELKKRYTTSATNARRYLEQQIGADYDTNVKIQWKKVFLMHKMQDKNI